MENNKITKPWWRDGVILFTKVSAYIAFPVIIASYVGKYLDKKYNTDQVLFFISVAVSFIFTILLILREVKIYKKSLEKSNQSEEK